MKEKQKPKHMRGERQRQIPDGANIAGVPTELPDTAHPLGIPIHEGDGEYVPIPGSNMAPNGAVIRNPWSEQPEIKPDNAYTDEKEDLDLLIM